MQRKEVYMFLNMIHIHTSKIHASMYTYTHTSINSSIHPSISWTLLQLNCLIATLRSRVVSIPALSPNKRVAREKPTYNCFCSWLGWKLVLDLFSPMSGWANYQDIHIYKLRYLIFTIIILITKYYPHRVTGSCIFSFTIPCVKHGVYLERILFGCV